VNRYDNFIEAVQAELDAGRDPLDRLEVVEWLQDHPESLDEFSNLRAVGLKLSALQPTHAVPPTVRSRKAVWKAVIALASAAGIHVIGFYRFLRLPCSKGFGAKRRNGYHAGAE